MACGRCVEDYVLEMGVLRAFKELHHFADGHCFVYAGRQGVQQLTCTNVRRYGSCLGFVDLMFVNLGFVGLGFTVQTRARW